MNQTSFFQKANWIEWREAVSLTTFGYFLNASCFLCPERTTVSQKSPESPKQTFISYARSTGIIIKDSIYENYRYTYIFRWIKRDFISTCLNARHKTIKDKWPEKVHRHIGPHKCNVAAVALKFLSAIMGTYAKRKLATPHFTLR